VQAQTISLRSLSGELQGRIWQSGQLLRVGRLPTSEVVLNDASVSRQHAEVALTSQGWVARDLGSTNGTYLNGTRIGRAEQYVRKGDILQFGELPMIVDISECLSLEEHRPADSGVQVAGTVKFTWEQIPQALECVPALGPTGKSRLLALIQTGRDFYRFNSVDDYLESILWEVAETMDAREGAFLLRDEKTGTLSAHASFSIGGQRDCKAWAEDNRARTALKRETSLLCHFGGAPVAEGANAGRRSIIYAMLRSPRGYLGVLCLARDSDQEPFSEAELKLADALALGVSAGIDSMAHLLEKQRAMFLQTLTALTQVVEMRGDAIYGQTQRVTDYALLLAEELELSDEDRHSLRVGVPLRDLGKIGVSDGLLKKPGELTPAEKEQIRSLFRKGTDLLEAIPGLAPYVALVRGHRERWDGTGYPDELRGEEIPLLARVVAVAEAFDAVSTDRPYRRGLALPEAFAEIERQAGTQFDPACVQALLRVRPRIEKLTQQRGQTTNTVSRDKIKEAVDSLGRQQRRAAGAARRPGLTG
jgi:HD-GYP domain-containing protein (c-di-GMP phosphodiesterase class II)